MGLKRPKFMENLRALILASRMARNSYQAGDGSSFPSVRYRFWQRRRRQRCTKNWNTLRSPPKRTRPETSFSNRIQMLVYRYPNPPPEAPMRMPGSYVSKRQRAVLSTNSTGNDDNRTYLAVSSVVGSILDSDIPHGILKTLRHHIKGGVHPNQTSEPLSAVLDGHTESVNALQWARTHSHLLASAGMDHMIWMWNVWSTG